MIEVFQIAISLVSQIVAYCFPFALVFGVTAKLANIALDMIFNRRIEM